MKSMCLGLTFMYSELVKIHSLLIVLSALIKDYRSKIMQGKCHNVKIVNLNSQTSESNKNPTQPQKNL